jgi:hypothetical protein
MTKIKGPIPIRIEEKELFISGSNSYLANKNWLFTDGVIIANKGGWCNGKPQ